MRSWKATHATFINHTRPDVYCECEKCFIIFFFGPSKVEKFVDLFIIICFFCPMGRPRRFFFCVDINGLFINQSKLCHIVMVSFHLDWIGFTILTSGVLIEFSL